MTEKETAKELIEKYLNQPINFPYIDTVDKQCIGAGYMTYKSAVKCAIIAVDEILSLGYVGNEPSSFRVYKFYSDVKSELELKN